MSKYDPLWHRICEENKSMLTLSFQDIESVLGFSIDHSFLNAKKELKEYGFQVAKISLKGRTVIFEKINLNHGQD